MIVSAAFCPHPPVLVPQVAGDAAPELQPLRELCRSVLVRAVSAEPDRIVLIGSGPRSLAHSPVARGSLSGYGVDLEVHLGSPGCGGDDELPLSLIIGAWLLEQVSGPRSGAVGFSIGPDFASSRAAVDLLALAEGSRVGLIVMGDGSARRSQQAPGYLDERAAGFDAHVLAALRAGDGDALAALDVDLGAELLAAGVPAWRAAGALLAGGEYDVELATMHDPYGVAYFTAGWLARG